MLRSFPARVASFTLVASTLFTATAMAGAPKTHDGFFLRLSSGAGTASSSIESQGDNIKLSGTPSEWNFAIGGMIKPNLALHATYWGWSIGDPDVDFNITGFGSGSGTLSGSATMGAFGGGVTYYFMPANIYASGSVGFGVLSLDAEGVTGESDTGFALDLTLGKEWWVGNSWGLGLAGGYTYHSLPDKDVSENWTGSSFALRFSATFN